MKVITIAIRPTKNITPVVPNVWFEETALDVLGVDQFATKLLQLCVLMKVCLVNVSNVRFGFFNFFRDVSQCLLCGFQFLEHPIDYAPITTKLIQFRMLMKVCSVNVSNVRFGFLNFLCHVGQCLPRGSQFLEHAIDHVLMHVMGCDIC